MDRKSNPKLSTSKRTSDSLTPLSNSFPSGVADSVPGFTVIYDWAPVENRDVNQKLQGIKAQSYILVYQNIDPDSMATGQIDPDKIIEDVRKRYGDNPTGWGMLDYEYPFDGVLQTGPKHPMYYECAKSMIHAVQRVKEAFPNVKWTYYGLPGLSYWLDGKLWTFASEEARRAEIEKQISGYGPVMEVLDWYTPCAYDVYDLSTMNEASRAEHLVNEKEYRIARVNVVREFLKRNNLPSRPIMPAVSPFFGEGGDAIANKIIPKDELVRDQIVPLIASKCDGMAIWTAGNWYIMQATIPTNPGNDAQKRVREVYRMDFFGGKEPEWTDASTKTTLTSGIGNAIADMGVLAVQEFSKPRR